MSRLKLPENRWQLPYRYVRYGWDREQGKLVLICTPRHWHPRWWLWQVNVTVATIIQMVTRDRVQCSWLVPRNDGPAYDP